MRKIHLCLVRLILSAANGFLCVFEWMFFRRISNPREIVVFKTGNIGDVVCAIPALVAIRHTFPKARIILLTSPGKKGAVGAKELLHGARYIDDIRVYYAEDIADVAGKKSLLAKVRSIRPDLFIQLPDDWAPFWTLFRNLIFAKLSGAKSAFGFRLRTVNFFKKSQVDFSFSENETESLLGILRNNGIEFPNVIFDIPVFQKAANVAEAALKKAGFHTGKDILVGICPGGKGEEKRWPVERFGSVAKYLYKKHSVKLIIFGGVEDKRSAQIILSSVGDSAACLDVTGVVLEEAVALARYCDLFLTNDTGFMHVAAAFGVPVVALFSIRSVYGKWFPYGVGHKILFKKFLTCDYREKQCIAESIRLILVDEVCGACDEVLASIQ